MNSISVAFIMSLKAQEGETANIDENRRASGRTETYARQKWRQAPGEGVLTGVRV